MASLTDMNTNKMDNGNSSDAIKLLCSDPIFFQASQSSSSVKEFISTLKLSGIEFSESDIHAFIGNDSNESQDLMHSFSQFAREVFSRISDEAELENVSGGAGLQLHSGINIGFGLANSLTSTGMQMGVLVQQANQSEELEKRREELQAKVEAFRASMEAKPN